MGASSHGGRTHGCELAPSCPRLPATHLKACTRVHGRGAGRLAVGAEEPGHISRGRLVGRQLRQACHVGAERRRLGVGLGAQRLCAGHACGRVVRVGRACADAGGAGPRQRAGECGRRCCRRCCGGGCCCQRQQQRKAAASTGRAHHARASVRVCAACNKQAAANSQQLAQRPRERQRRPLYAFYGRQAAIRAPCTAPRGLARRWCHPVAPRTVEPWLGLADCNVSSTHGSEHNAPRAAAIAPSNTAVTRPPRLPAPPRRAN